MRRVAVGLLVGLLLMMASVAVSAQSPLPSPVEAVQRVEVPEVGVALELPDGWLVDVEMREFHIEEDPNEELIYSESGELISDLGGQLIGVSVFQAYSPTRHPRCGLLTHDTPFARSFAKLSLHAGLISGRETWFVEEADHWSRSEVDLPAGDTFKVAYGGVCETGPCLEAVHYFIDTGDRFAMFFCVTEPITHPDDDWLSIAETIEFLPAEE